MTVGEQIWFVIAIAGFLIFFEAAITKLLKNGWTILYKYFPSIGVWKDSHSSWGKIVTGLIIFLIALYKLSALAGN